MKLADICNIISGQLTNRVLKKNNESLPVLGKVKVLAPKAIVNGKVIHEDIVEEEYVKDLNPETLTREGDIILKLSSPYDACLITKEDEGLLIPSFSCRIVPDSKYTWYILAFLASSNCKEQIMSQCAGTVISLIKINSIRSLYIPDLDEKKIEEISNKYKKAVTFKQLVDEIYHYEMISNDIEFDVED